jgi:dTDP-4-amino-4,6-dideoxygalactose transaminase
MAIQVFVPKFRIDECLEQIRECLEKGWTGLGFKTVEFEEAWCNYTGLPHAHFLNSATSGLHLAVYQFKTKYGWSDGDEIITSPLTFVSTNHVILYERLTPVFADVDHYLCLDPEDIERKITPRTRAVMFVGLGGNTGQFDRVLEICKKNKLKLILDAAHMAGARLGDKHVGFGADCAIFSFQAVKNLPTGDSGMICFADPEDDARARKLSWLGINKDTFARTTSQGTYKWMYDVEEAGFKYHGNSVMAAIALVSLKYLDEDNQYRRQIATWYDECFSSANRISPVLVAPNCLSSRHFYQIRTPVRDKMMEILNSKDIYPGVHYRDNRAYTIYASGRDNCPVSTKASDEIISLPVHMALTKEDVFHIADVAISC